METVTCIHLRLLGVKVVFFAETADEADPALKVEAKHDLGRHRGERNQAPRQKKTTVPGGGGGGGE